MFRIERSEHFKNAIAAILDGHSELGESLEGIEWVLERDPEQGLHLANGWRCLSGRSRKRAHITIFYSVDGKVVTLESAVRIME